MALKRPRIATLEAFIVDTFTRIDKGGKEKPVDTPDQIGGAGTYAIIGARLFLPPTRLAMIVDYTPETLPPTMQDTLSALGDSMWFFRLRNDGHGTTRSVNRYNGETRIFEYLSEPRLITPRDLLETDFRSPLPGWLHLCSFPDRGEQTIREMAEMGPEAEAGWLPGLVWEPEPVGRSQPLSFPPTIHNPQIFAAIDPLITETLQPCCVPENLQAIARVARHVDVISPNHTEALSLFDISPPENSDLVLIIEWLTRRLVAMKPHLAAIIRAGPLGCCYALTSELPLEFPAHTNSIDIPAVPVYWVPPYWMPGVDGYEKTVIDPTGAGNAFMGGLMAGLDEGKDVHEATVWATVAASFIVQQPGLPSMTKLMGRELWNGVPAWERVELLRQRIAATR